MTITEQYRRRDRLIGLPILVIVAALTAGLFYVHTRLMQLTLACLGLFLLVSFLYLLGRFACLRCNQPMGLISATPTTAKVKDKPVRCRHCAVNVQEPYAIT